MNKYFSFSAIIMFAAMMLVSCSQKLKPAGTWNITRYEIIERGNRTVSVNNIGTITFRKNGAGEKNINYTVGGKTKTDNSDFGWYVTGPYIGIESPHSEFSKTWIIVTNKKKEQKWQSKDEANRVRLLELKK
jgi:hypothetical protein